MPPAIAAFAAWASISVAAAYVVVATVVISVGTAVYGAAQARKAERKARDELNASMKDRMVTRIATEAPHRYIYGRAKVGADIVAMFTSGDKDQYKHLVCVHAAHECDEIEEVWVNNALVDSINADGDPTAGRFAVMPGTDVIEENHTGPTFTLAYSPRNKTVWVFGGEGTDMHRLPVTSVNGKTVTINFTGPVVVNYERAVFHNASGPVSENQQPTTNPVVRVQKHLGGADDGVDLFLRTIMLDKWPLTAVLRGLCYTVITLDLNHTEFQSGLVPIHAVIRGRKLYDPRDGQTRWSQNPALAVMDYLTSPLCDVPMSDLPLAQFITAANVCDEAAPTIGARYTINGTVTSDQDQKGVLEAMAQCMAGGLVATTWDVYAGKYIAPVAALTQDDIVGSLSINPGVSDASVYNGVKGQYIGPENKYVQTDFAPYQNPTYREADGRDLYTNLDFPFTESLQRVTNLARIFTEDQRNGFTIKAEFSLKAWPLKVGQRITYTSRFIGQTNKVYRITDKGYAPNSAVQLTLKEDAASIWDFADAVELDSTPNSELPDPWKIDPLESIDCTSGESTLLRQADGSTVPRILVSWPATAQQSGVQVEVEWRAVSSPTWERTTVSADGTQAYLSPITPGFFYIVRARCVNPSMNTRSGWVTTVYQVEVFAASPTVYLWAAEKPAPPDGAASYVWASGTFGAAPAGWSLTEPAAPAGGNVSLWAASVAVSDISAVATPFSWAGADVVNIGYAPSAAGTGPAGYSNARVFAYQRKATAPSGTPGAVNYDFTTGTITTASLANGWQKTMPAADGNPLYVTSASASAAGTTDTIASNEWAAAVVMASDGGAGAPGLNNATVQIYQRSASATAPTKPSASTTYTFATGVLSALNNGWTTYIPTAGGAYLHTTQATAIASTATDSIQASEWAAVRLMYDAADLIAAKEAADAALNAVATISDDNILSKAEKPDVILLWEAIAKEHMQLYDLATAYNLISARDSFYEKVSLLASYLDAAEYTNLAKDNVIVGETLRSRFSGYYTAKASLQDAIAVAIRTRTTLAEQAANSAATQAALANTAITDMARDDLLSPSEKPAESLRWATIVSERPGIDAQAAALGITAERTAYANAYTALNTYITGLGSQFATIPGTAISIVGATYRTNFKAYYDAKQALLNAVAAKSATVAQWAGVGGAGRPADNASSDLVLIPNGAGAISVVGNRVVKTSNGGWGDASVHSKESYIGGCYASARAEGVFDIMFGLNSDPATDANFPSIDYAVYLAWDGSLQVYESGSWAGTFGSYAAGDVFAVVYDGSSIRYTRNGAVFKTTNVSAPIAAALSFDSAFATSGAALSNIRFGPLSSNNWSNIGGTGKPQDGATVGAPAGTTVGTTPATTVEQTVNDINSPFSISLSGTLASSVAAGGPRTYGTLTAALGGGSGTVTLLWECQVRWTDSSTGASVQLSLTGNDFARALAGTAPNGTSVSYTVKVTANDSKGRSRTATREGSTSHGTIQ